MSRKIPHLAGGLANGSTFDILSPYFTASRVIALSSSQFGSRAATLCAYYALDAQHAGRQGDYRLWLTAFKHHQQNQNQSAS